MDLLEIIEKLNDFKSILTNLIVEENSTPIVIGKLRETDFEVGKSYYAFRNNGFIPLKYTVTYIRSGWGFIVWEEDGENAKEEAFALSSVFACTSESIEHVFPEKYKKYTNVVSSFEYLNQLGIKPNITYINDKEYEEKYGKL